MNFFTANETKSVVSTQDSRRSNADQLDLRGGRFRAYRAPREHGEAFVEPAFDQAWSVLQANQRLLAKQTVFEANRLLARRQMIEDAVRYTSVYRTPEWLAGLSVGELLERPIVMAGHQPALFHPGVWFKNFALSHVAEQTGALAINLVIDNDVASGSSIRVPTLATEIPQASYVSVPFDDAGGGVPYEQTTIQNRDVFERFPSE